MPVATMLPSTVHQPVNLTLGEVASLDCQVYDAWCAFLGCRFHADKLSLPVSYCIYYADLLHSRNFLNLMGGVVLEPDQHGGRSCARRQLFGWCLMGVRCDPRGGGTFQFQTFILAPSPEIC